MPIVNVRQLARQTSSVLAEVVRTRKSAVVTKGGRPIALVSPMNADEFEDWILANAPGFVRSLRQADADLAAGRAVLLEDVLAGLKRGRRDTKRRGPRRATPKT